MKNLIQTAVGAAVAFAASVIRMAGLVVGVKAYCEYTLECFAPDGTLKWSLTKRNLMPNVGLDDLLSNYWKGSGYTASFYVGLMSASPTVAAGDTMASHAGWTELTAYSESARQGLTLGSVSGQSVDNSASKASFTINADSTTIGGAFVTTDATKGGTAGTLVSGASIGSGKTIDNGDLINVTVTCTAASA